MQSDKKTDVCDSYSPGYDKTDPHYQDLILEISGISEIFKVLSDETRARILYLLTLNNLADSADLAGCQLKKLNQFPNQGFCTSQSINA